VASLCTSTSFGLCCGEYGVEEPAHLDPRVHNCPLEVDGQRGRVPSGVGDLPASRLGCTTAQHKSPAQDLHVRTSSALRSPIPGDGPTRRRTGTASDQRVVEAALAMTSRSSSVTASTMSRCTPASALAVSCVATASAPRAQFLDGTARRRCHLRGEYGQVARPSALAEMASRSLKAARHDKR